MIKFLLVLEETDGPNDEFTGRQASKVFGHSVLPGLGHQVVIDGNGYPVREIEHAMLSESEKDGLPAIRVLIPWSNVDFESLWNDDSWHNENFG